MIFYGRLCLSVVDSTGVYHQHGGTSARWLLFITAERLLKQIIVDLEDLEDPQVVVIYRYLLDL